MGFRHGTDAAAAVIIILRELLFYKTFLNHYNLKRISRYKIAMRLRREMPTSCNVKLLTISCCRPDHASCTIAVHAR